MRFLVRMRAVQPIPLGPADLARLALQQLDYWERLSKSGHVLFTAPFVGRRARVAIYEVSSNEELFDLINDDPLFPYLEREVIPLASNEQIRELYRRMVSADGAGTGDRPGHGNQPN